jgi:hypothetical protein
MHYLSWHGCSLQQQQQVTITAGIMTESETITFPLVKGFTENSHHPLAAVEVALTGARPQASPPHVSHGLLTVHVRMGVLPPLLPIFGLIQEAASSWQAVMHSGHGLFACSHSCIHPSSQGRVGQGRDHEQETMHVEQMQAGCSGCLPSSGFLRC